MIVITMTDCPPKLRGDLTKWLFEIDTGVYVGNVSAKVREALWLRIRENIKDGRATMVYNASNEQRLEFRTHNSTRKIRDFDGIKLMMRPNSSASDAEELPRGFSSASKRRISGRRRNAAHSDAEWAFLDIETTGLDPQKDRIIEIAVLVADKSRIISEWSSLIKSDTQLPSHITELTHITDEMLSGGAELIDALEELSELVKGKTVICYNGRFDIAFLENAYNKNALEFPIGKAIDILPQARRKIMGIENYKLGSLAEYFKIPCETQHRAAEDCEILYRVFLKLNEI